MEIYGKDFWRHVGKTILMPHPTNPNILPVRLKIIAAKKKRVTMTMESTGDTMTTTYSKDKNKYKVVE